MRTNSLTKWIAVLAMVGASSLASAAVVGLGNSSPGSALGDGDFGQFSATQGAGAVNDKWYFNLVSDSDVAARAVGIVFDNPLSMPSLTLQLYKTSDNSTVGGSTTTPNLLSLSGLSFGSYYLHITGIAAGQGLQYVGNVAVSAVPLPAAALLLLSGLAGVGVMARRRREANTAAA
jgi:hypothetical protein